MRAFLAMLFVSLFATPPLLSQRWLSELPRKPESELTFRDYQQAFASYYRKHPIDPKRDKLKPTFVFPKGEDERDRMAIEEYKMFKRWEWFAEPRVYPTGRWDFEKLDAIKVHVPEADRNLVLKQTEANRLGARVVAGGIIWPTPLKWIPLGPADAVGGTNLGRVNCIRFDPVNPMIIYIGAPDGGVWKTTDGGVTWVPEFDTQPTLSVGDVAIDPTNTNVLYASTSDAFGYGSPFWGGTYSVGVRKSTDGGSTWSATGLSWTVGQNRTIRRLAIHPTNGNILLAATSNGLYRTADAGVTWAQLWPASTFDVEFQQNNGNIVYATTSQTLKSTNAGATFSPLTPTCAGTRYDIEIARSNPNVLYTLCDGGPTVQKSSNAGVSWSTTSASGVSLYGYYDNVLAVSPVDEKIVYVAGFNIRRTTDGGTTWSSVPTAGHADNHWLAFLPGSSSTIFSGNDGGLFKTTNSGASWSSLNKGLGITQFYRLGNSRTNVDILIAGAQDNGNMKSTAGVFTNITNADGMDGFIDWSNAKNIYAGIQNGGFYRSTNAGATFTNVSTPGTGAWVAPWSQHPTVANTLFAATDKVYKSLNQGTTWTPISGVLAGISELTVLTVAPSNPNVIYAGNGNRLYLTKNGGTTWTDVTVGLPVASNYLTAVAVHDTDPTIAYVTFSGYNAGQKVYKTLNSGASWSNISGSLPNLPANCIVHQKANNNPLYVGTDEGVYYINDTLSDWVPYKPGLPNVIIDDLEIHYGNNTIRAATYGRGIWQAPLQ